MIFIASVCQTIQVPISIHAIVYWEYMKDSTCCKSTPYPKQEFPKEKIYLYLLVEESTFLQKELYYIRCIFFKTILPQKARE